MRRSLYDGHFKDYLAKVGQEIRIRVTPLRKRANKVGLLSGVPNMNNNFDSL